MNETGIIFRTEEDINEELARLMSSVDDIEDVMKRAHLEALTEEEYNLVERIDELEYLLLKIEEDSE